MMKIEVLGPGCPNCRKLKDNVDDAARGLGLEYELQSVTGIEDIVARGVMATPALVVNGEVRMSGRVPSVEEIRGLLEDGPPQFPGKESE